MDQLIGQGGILWEAHPPMGLVLLSSVPSGSAQVVGLRHQLQAMLACPPLPKLAPGVITLQHSCAPGPYHGQFVYIGFGQSDPQGRPSPFANPFEFTCPLASRIAAFEDFMDARADLSWFLRPLCGKTLVCDCDHAHLCHGTSLIKYVHRCFALENAGPSLGVSSCAVESEEADDSGDERPSNQGVFKPEDWHSIDETLRGRPDVRAERPKWPKTWSLLVACVRAAQVLLFWEIFSGTAGLTKAFQDQGWQCAPPLDIIFNEAYNLMDPGFVCVVLGLIFERRFKLIHLGPPCSSFSMAVNRFTMHAMRSWDQPDGFECLTQVQRDKVTLGNALARVAIFIATAQIQVGMFFCLEQPESSLMWRFTPMQEFMDEKQVFFYTFHACAFGAPWKKPTAILTNFMDLAALQLYCVCVSVRTRCLQAKPQTAAIGRQWHPHIGHSLL